MQTIEFGTPTHNEKGEIIVQARNTAEQFTEALGNGLNLQMIVIHAGVIQMGSPRNTGSLDEQLQHFLTIKSFLMGKYLITKGRWKAVPGELPPCRFKGDNLPVERVSWNDAQKFCQQLSQRMGRNYQLPSETQWEYACRAGASTPLRFGETLTVEVANFNGEYTFGGESRGFYFHSTSTGRNSHRISLVSMTCMEINSTGEQHGTVQRTHQCFT